MNQSQIPNDANALPTEREALSRLPDELLTSIAPPPPCECDMCQDAKRETKAFVALFLSESGPIQPGGGALK